MHLLLNYHCFIKNKNIALENKKKKKTKKKNFPDGTNYAILILQLQL